MVVPPVIFTAGEEARSRWGAAGLRDSLRAIMPSFQENFLEFLSFFLELLGVKIVHLHGLDLVCTRERRINSFAVYELARSEEHTSELQSRGLISYAVFC